MADGADGHKRAADGAARMDTGTPLTPLRMNAPCGGCRALWHDPRFEPARVVQRAGLFALTLGRGPERAPAPSPAVPASFGSKRGFSGCLR